MQYFCRQIDVSVFLQKRAVFTVGNAPAPRPQNLVTPEMLTYRDSIEDKSIDELKAEFTNQSNALWKKQQSIMEIVEDLNTPKANIPQGVKNELILKIADELEKNSKLVISEQLKFSLGSHLKPAKRNTQQWLTKVSLMAGAMGAMSEDMDENAPRSKRFGGMVKWFKVLMAIMSGKTIAAPQSETQNISKKASTNSEQAPEAPPVFANKAALESIRLVESADVRSSGYFKVNAPSAKDPRRTIKIKHDGSEITGANKNESHPLAKFLQTKAIEINRNAGILGKTSPSQRVDLAKAIFDGQREVNRTSTPVDVSMLLNDNMTWALNRDPYNGNKEIFFRALTTKPTSGLNPLMAVLKGRYDVVRSTMTQLNSSKRNVKQKLEETAQFMISKLAPGSGKAAAEKSIRDRFNMAVSNARSLQNPGAIYGLALTQVTSELAKASTSSAGRKNPYSSSENIKAVSRKIQEAGQFFTKKKQALGPIV
jgi:hypothetical protein